MSSRSKMVGDQSKGREKLLSMTWGCEAAHGSFALSGRLMRIFRLVVESFVLTVLDTWHDLPLCGCIASQFVRDDHAWNVLEPLEKLAEELFCRFLVAPTLDQNVKYIAILIHRSPERVLLAIDFEKHFIKMPRVTRL